MPLIRTKTSHAFSCFAFLAALFLTSAPVHAAAHHPLTVESPLTNLTFDDPPAELPITDDFTNAMAKVAKEFNLRCTKTEAYGWRMDQSEQARVNQIFFTTADKLRNLGYGIETKTLSSVGQDVTLFSAKSTTKNFLLMWSAGNVGLVLVLCGTEPLTQPTQTTDTTPPPPLPTESAATTHTPEPQPSTPIVPEPIVPATFSPLGAWTGNYTCQQSYTGGTLTITQLESNNITANFHFFPTPKNLTVPEGSYEMAGTYDSESQAMKLHPVKWIDRPVNFISTDIVGKFDPIAKTFSGYFQGVADCTSFQAKYTSTPLPDLASEKKKATPPVKKIRHKKAAKPLASKTPTPKDTVEKTPEPQQAEALPPPPTPAQIKSAPELTLEVGAPVAPMLAP